MSLCFQKDFIKVSQEAAPILGSVLYISCRLMMNKGPCQVEVDTSSESLITAASYLDIWRAGVAVNTMCVQFGKAGTASGIGESFCRDAVGPATET